MDRRRFLAVSASMVAAPLVAEAQPAGRVPRVGYLSLVSAEDDRSRVIAFQQGLRELGYLEGRNIFIEQRYAAGEVEKFREQATELVRLKVDVLVQYGRLDTRQPSGN